ncbi:MAG TPA: hypothetical protein PLF83_00055 [Rectinema sp.]|nr:MAG: hypothetical protein BWX44_00412 [Spirochaetes bacterium ADurb.Bin001]HNV35722.1 hypothetical protein [Rectinema sp.]HQN02290.1 hypothetical protein [Rectinema sp.]
MKRPIEKRSFPAILKPTMLVILKRLTLRRSILHISNIDRQIHSYSLIPPKKSTTKLLIKKMILKTTV